MCFSIVGGHLTCGCTIKEHPDQTNYGPANQRIDNHRYNGCDFQNMILESWVAHNTSKWPEEQVAQLVNECSEGTARVCTDQHQNNSDSDQGFQGTKE